MGISIYSYENEEGQKRFAAFTSISDCFLCHDMTKEEITEWWGERGRQKYLEDIQFEWDFIERHGYSRGLFITDNKKEFKSAIKRHLELKNCDDQDYNQEIKELLKKIDKK